MQRWTLTGSGSGLPAGNRVERASGRRTSGTSRSIPVGLRSELDAMLQLDVASPAEATAPTGRLSGTITVLRGSYREPLAVVGGLLAAMRARRVAATGGASEEQSAFLKQLALDIRVQTDEDIIVDNNYARAQLGGDLNLIGSASCTRDLGTGCGLRKMASSSSAETSIRFHVTRRARWFVSPTSIEPELNIHVRTRSAVMTSRSPDRAGGSVAGGHVVRRSRAGGHHGVAADRAHASISSGTARRVVHRRRR